jgi:acetyl esterase/lipase
MNPNDPASVERQRAAVEKLHVQLVETARQRYPVDIVPEVIAGVRTQIITSREGEADRRRVLINLHGGAFQVCAQACALEGSIPVASIGRYKVITVDYRQGPEHHFPAATEDAVAVYRELLKTYRPENIGIYGCSAGGRLTAQVESWLQSHNLPNPGAIGIFGSGAAREGARGPGDSAYVAAYVDGTFIAGDGYSPPSSGAPSGYFAGTRADDPLIAPGLYPEILARFPPTLIITGTRAMDMSAAVYTHSQLLKVGVDSQLIVGEGMRHCYIEDANVPEARDANQYIVRFFDTHLGRKPARAKTKSHPKAPTAR